MGNMETNDYPVGGFSSVFTGNELFLADHIIQGKKILPGMAYLELARAAVANSVPISDKYMIVLSESIFVKALVVTEECNVEVKVYPGARGEFGVEVSTAQGIHFQSKVSIQRKEEQLEQGDHMRIHDMGASLVLDIGALKQRCDTAGPTKQQFYKKFANREVNLGPSHRGVEQISLGNSCALIKVALPGSSNRGMCMDPGMLDSLIQGGVILASNDEAYVVPFAVLKTRVFTPLTDEMYAYITKQDQSLNYVMADKSGEIKVIIDGFLTREIDLNSQQDQLVFYKPEWRADEPTEVSGTSSTIISGAASYSELVGSLFTLAKKLIQDKADGHLVEVQLTGQQQVWKAILAALRTVNLEYSKINYKLKIENKELSLGYSAVEMESTAIYRWPDNKTILITGGLGGIGRLIATDIARSSKGCELILVGSSSLDDKRNENINHIEVHNAKVTYVQCDITNKADVEALVSRFPNINGIIHGAGVINDNYISNKSLDDIASVLAPKVQGLEYLDQATVNCNLDYFIVLSSVAGLLGNAGQIDYAAANAYMDQYITDRATLVRKGERRGKSISVNWPLWDSEGMQISQEAKETLLKVFKIKPLPFELGLTALKKAIASDHSQLMVLFGNRKTIHEKFSSLAPINKKEDSKKISRKQPKAETNKLSKQILQEIRIQTAEHLKIRPNQLDERADWEKFGFDSIMLSSFINRLNTRFDLNLMPTVFFEATNMLLFSQYLAENNSEQMMRKLSLPQDASLSTATASSLSSGPDPKDEHLSKVSNFALGFKKSYKSSASYRERDVAIVGLSCRIAGAKNPKEFWRMLAEEKDMISEIPEDRWAWRDYPECSKWGSFIDGVTEFDSLFFGISPAEAIYMAPEQRLMMQYVWECIEDAGCGGDEIKGTNTGLYIGCGPSGYQSLLRDFPVEAYSATGLVSSVGPNRISYWMDWRGPSNPIDTACSSALVAVHRAVEAIRAGHCDQAIAGGVNLLLTPDVYISFSKAGMLCEDGRCKTFSDKANGYVRGEGVGMLMLKPIRAAIEDGNTIYALVKGTAENHGGRTNSLTAPNPKSQASVIKKSIADAGIDFSRVTYIECHGTGTELGDPVEIQGLKTVANDLLEDNNANKICRLGSIKSNIGHLEYAAGAVGLIKTILQIKHKKIARSLHCDSINPYIDLTGTPFAIAQKASDWEVPPGQTRVAGVSSFGFGGVNAHIVLEEFREIEPPEQEEAGQKQLLLLSAKSEKHLIEYVARFSSYVSELDEEPTLLKRIAYTLQVGRTEMPERLVFVATSVNEWAEQMNLYLMDNGKSYSRNIFRGSIAAGASSTIEISDTDAGKDYINKLIATNEVEKIAELWVKGTRIDWQSLY